MITGELKNKIDSMWDVFAAGGVVNPLDVIEQTTYLMFIHDLDDSDNRRANKQLTKTDIDTLEQILWSELGSKDDYVAEYGDKPLGEFVREIVGLDMNAAKEAFASYLSDTTLDSRQIYFVNQIIEYIVHNGMLKDFSVMQDSPFTDQGSVVEIFTDLSVWTGIRRIIEEINTNAIVG